MTKAKKTPQTARSKTIRSREAGKRPSVKHAPKKTARATASIEKLAPMSLSRRVSWGALLAMMFLVPLATSNFTLLGFQNSFTADVFEIVKVSVERILALVALGAWAWDILRRGGRIRHTPVDWAILAFLAWVAITTVTSIHWPTALLGRPRRYEGLATYISYALIFFLVLQFADHASRVRRLAQSLFWASVIVSAFGLAQFLGLTLSGWQPLGFESNRAFATFGNPDFLGGFLVFSVTIALGLALLEGRTAWRLVYWVGFGLNGLALIATFTRGAWIGGFVSLLILAAAAWRQRTTLRRIDWVPAGASIVLGISIVVRSLASSSEVLNFGKRIASIFQFGSGSGQTRTLIWQAALSSIRDRPVFGWGADTFRLVFHKYKPVEYVQIKGGSLGADNAHNYLLHLASGTGIPGALLFCVVLVWAGVRSFSSVFRRSDQSGRIMLAAFWAASLGYLVHLVFGISVAGASFLLWIALALVLGPTARSADVKPVKWGTWAALAVIALAAVGIGYQGVDLAADGAYSQSLIGPSAPERTAGALRAAKLNPLNPEYRLSVGLAYYAEMRAYLQAGAEAQRNGEDTSKYVAPVQRSYANAESAMIRAKEFTPAEYDNYVALATLYNLAGSALDKDLYQKAIDIAEQGIEVMPLGTAIRVQLSSSLAATGKTDEAVDTLKYCLDIDPTGSEAALALATIYRGQGKTAEALSLLKSLDALAPGQPGVADAIKDLESGVPAQ